MTHEYPKAGNWMRFNSFGWHDKPDDAENWTIYNTAHRDSGLLDQSNAAVIDRTLEAFPDDAEAQHFGHWAVGWVDAWAVRVDTPAYAALCELIDRMADYPILDESDYSQRESDATFENVQSALRFCGGIDRDKLPDDAASSLYEWLGEHDESQLENSDDQGGWPDDDAIRACVADLWPDALEAA